MKIAVQLIAIALLIAFGSIADADELPDKPALQQKGREVGVPAAELKYTNIKYAELLRAHKSALKNWKWWAGEGVQVAAMVASAQVSCNGYKRGLVEGFGLTPGVHSCGLTYAITGVGIAAETALHWWIYNVSQESDSKAERAFGYLEIPTITTGIMIGVIHHDLGVGGAGKAATTPTLKNPFKFTPRPE